MVNDPGIKQSVSVEEVVDFLNECLKLDRSATTELVSTAKVETTTDAFPDHPTIQCGVSKEGKVTIGIIGLLNGLFGAYTDGPKKRYGAICYLINDDGSIKEFSLTKNVEDKE